MKEILKIVKCSIVIHVILLSVQIAWKKIVNFVIEIFVPIRIY